MVIYNSSDIIRYTSCSTACNGFCILKVRIRNGVIISCEPDDTINSDVSADGSIPEHGIVNTRPCVKGYALRQMVYDPARLTYPVKRTGKRGEGKFERVSWDEALDTITHKLVEIRGKYGPYSIMMPDGYGKSGFPLAPWFGAGVGGWDAHSRNGWDEPEIWVLGSYGLAGGSGSPASNIIQDEANIFKSKLIVIWGMDPLAMLGGGAVLNLLEAKKRGIPIIFIEARYTESVEMLADQWIPIRPTTDVAMMIAMANVWFKADLCDKEFIGKYVEPVGLEKWQAYVLGNEDGVDKTPDWAESICGVPAETIAEFARLYAHRKPVNLTVSWSMGRQFYGENATRASMYLQALTGNTCSPGGTAAAGTGTFGNGDRALPAPGPAVDWQRKPGTFTPPVLMEEFKWVKAIDLRDRLDEGKLSKEEYNNLIGNAAGNPSPNFKMIILQDKSQVMTLPDTNSCIRAMKKADFSVVFSQYTDALHARYADMVLPMIFGQFEGRNCMGGRMPPGLFVVSSRQPNFLLYCQKCIDPPGEVKSNDWIWTQIARRLGIANLFNPRMAHVPDEKWDDNIEDLHREAYEKWIQRPEIRSLNPPGWGDFQNKPIFRWDFKDAARQLQKDHDIHYPFKEEIENGKNPFRETGSGKIEFYSSVLAKGQQYLSTDEHPVKGNARCYGPGSLPPMAKMIKGGRDTFFSEDTIKYPLLMSTPHTYYRVHSFMDNNPWLRGDCYRHSVWISIVDAGARGIKDDDIVKVYNDIGEIVLPAYVTSRVVPGTVCLFYGTWYQPGEETSELMPDGIDLSGGANFLVHNDDLPDTVLGMFPCKGLVEIIKYKEVE